MSELITCIALMPFSRFVSGHGIIHGDPDNSKAKKVNVPEHSVQSFIDEGFVKPPKGYEAPTVEIVLPGAPVGENGPPAEGEGEGEQGAPV